MYSTGLCLGHCAIPSLLLLLHNPAGPALPVLFCWPASSGKNRLGKGRQRRMHPTSVKDVHYPGQQNALASVLWFTASSLFFVKKLFPFRGNDVIHLPPSLLALSLSSYHLGFLWEECGWVHVCATVFSRIPSTQFTHIPVGYNITAAAWSQQSHYLIQSPIERKPVAGQLTGEWKRASNQSSRRGM